MLEAAEEQTLTVDVLREDKQPPLTSWSLCCWRLLKNRPLDVLREEQQPSLTSWSLCCRRLLYNRPLDVLRKEQQPPFTGSLISLLLEAAVEELLCSF